MITLSNSVATAIQNELKSIPEKYHKPFNSVHEGYGVLMEEVKELEDEIFFGEKRAKDHPYAKDTFPIDPKDIWKGKMRREAIQVAAMAIRFIQELT